MASTITGPRPEPAKETVGGLKAVYIINFEDANLDIAESSSDSGLTIKRISRVGSVATDVTAYKFDLKGNSSYVENVQSSRENGTLVFEQVLELTLKRLTKESHKEIKALSFGRPHIIIEDYNGNLLFAGREHGMEVTGGTIVTGTAMTDLSGYTLTFTGMERKPAQFLEKTSETEAIATTLTNQNVSVDSTDADTDLD